MIRAVAIIQARMGSSRLPGKVLRMLGGETMLARVVRRTCRAKTLDDVIVATTANTVDESIIAECVKLSVPVFRGSEQDVLDRYYRAAVAYQADAVVRITSDCPLIEPEIIDTVNKAYIDCHPNVDYAYNTLFPVGLDTEVMGFHVLERAWHEDTDLTSREHVTPYIYENPDIFRIHRVESSIDFSHMRWTVDTADDLVFVRQIYDHFGHSHFSWRDVLDILKQNPQWLELNQHVKQKTIPRHGTPGS